MNLQPYRGLIFRKKKGVIFLLNMTPVYRKFDLQIICTDLSANHTTNFKSYRHYRNSRRFCKAEEKRR